MAATILTPEEAVQQVELLTGRGHQIRGVFISGPGEPLANAATYVVLRQLNWRFPDLALVLSTNGLLLRDRIEQIIADGVRSVAITVNAFKPETAKKIYSSILYKGRRYRIEDAADFLIKNQWQGLMLAADAGLQVLVNSILIPGLNEDEMALIAEKAGKLGVKGMNIHPLIPENEFDRLTPPDEETIRSVVTLCRAFIPQGRNSPAKTEPGGNRI
jgi:nitrogen fixation protein NifB